jgi:hypothetical protein
MGIVEFTLKIYPLSPSILLPLMLNNNQRSLRPMKQRWKWRVGDRNN